MKRTKLNVKIIAILVILMFVMSAAIIYISSTNLRNTYYEMYKDKGEDLVKMVADQMDGDWLREYSKTFEQDSKYDEAKSFLDNIKTDFHDIQYLYIQVPGEDRFVYLIDAQTPDDDPANISTPGDVYEYEESDYEYFVPDIKAKKASDQLILGPDVGYGRLLSVWAPIFDSNGEMVAMVDADYVLSEINPIINRNIIKIALVEVFCILAVVLLMVFILRSLVIRPITSLSDIVSSYEHGELVEDISIFDKNNDEITTLAYSFRDMTVRIEEYIRDLTIVTAEKERIGAELNVATKIQADMLPRIFPPFPERTEFELFASMNPAKEVGGDFYDYFLIDDDHLGFVMADVSGKGVPAALFMVIAKTLIKNRALMGDKPGPGEILAYANEQLCEGNDAELFVTVWLGIFTISTGHVQYSSAGHEYPVYYRNNKGFDLEKEKHGPPVATMEGLRFREHETVLQKGEMIFLYTDGVTEATSEHTELFGEDRLVESLNKYSGENVEDILKNLRKDIDEFVGDAPQFDDITMFCLKYNGNE
ncbi:MAG: SpoIIE family protein phosphatase [Lachnospiraceae bacterium]|nr:SpoIIE family protein phosphatase [Lachnospiraceae bacterium]